jgi:hypothetical protein
LRRRAVTSYRRDIFNREALKEAAALEGGLSAIACSLWVLAQPDNFFMGKVL